MNLKLFKRKKQRHNHLLITYINPSSKVSEEYRSIRTNLKFTPSQKYKSLIITSPNSGEGKSTIVANLGISLAQQGDKVLIVDTNLRQPAMHKIFKIDNTFGLSSFLNGSTTLDSSVEKTEIGRLDVITSGPVPKNPAELLGTDRMTELMDHVMDHYDVILYDTSSVLEVTDTNIFANRCDGVILVLTYGKTEGYLAMEAKRILEQSKANIIGTVLNERV